MAFILRFTIDTWLKQATVQGASLPDDQRQFIEARTTLPLSSFAREGNHLKVTLGKDNDGKQIAFKGRNTWFVYEPAIAILQNGQIIDPDTREPKTPAYSLRIDLDTFLKQSMAQSSTLPDDQKQFVNAGTTLPLSSFAPAGEVHLQVTLGFDSQGKQVSFKGLNTWFVYRPAVDVLKDGSPVSIPAPTKPGPVYTLKILNDTVLKLSTAQSATLPESQKQPVAAGDVLPISSYALADNTHLRVAFGLDENGKQVAFKGRNTWYVYQPVAQVLRDGQPVNVLSPLTGKIITLDPGHGEILSGGNDPGALNPILGRNERDEVRKQTDRVRQLLAAKGASVAIVENNTRMSLPQIGAQAKGSDCFVSLHLNAFNRSAQGHEVLVHRSATALSEQFARLVNQALAESLDIPNRGVKRRGLAVLAGVPSGIPAILTEAFFIDALTSAATLDDWNERAAVAIARGIEQFLLQ